MMIRNLITIPCLFTLFAAPACDVDVDGSAESILVDEADALPAADLVDAGDEDDTRQWTPELDLENFTDPAFGFLCSNGELEEHEADNGCGSCSPQPNMPGRLLTYRVRWCGWCEDSNGTPFYKCFPWKIDNECHYC